MRRREEAGQDMSWRGWVRMRAEVQVRAVVVPLGGRGVMMRVLFRMEMLDVEFV